MDIELTKLKQKIEDYSRFLITLLILSVYFYLGMIINIFIEPTDKSTILIVLLISSISLAGWYCYLLNKWRKQMQQMIEQ